MSFMGLIKASLKDDKNKDETVKILMENVQATLLINIALFILGLATEQTTITYGIGMAVMLLFLGQPTLQFRKSEREEKEEELKKFEIERG